MQILGLWAAAAVPKALLAWALAPALITWLQRPPALIFWILIVIGLAWQFGLSLWIVQREEGSLSWSTLCRRTWLNAPQDPRTGQTQAGSLWRLLPTLVMASGIVALGALITSMSTWILFLLRVPYLRYLILPTYTNVLELASPDFASQWWLLGLAVVSWLFAEELLFRGILLPKMAGVFGQRDWVANAALYGLYSLHKPWMIPFRFLEGLLIARTSRRLTSNLIALGVRGLEGLGLLGLVLIGVTSEPLTQRPTTFTFPSISRRPGPLIFSKGKITTIPACDLNSGDPFQVDLRGADLSALDLRGSSAGLACADFDSRTIWPPTDRLPQDFDPQRILELGKNPGLGLRSLHAQGITGRGVGIAIIDQPLLVEHQEYADRLRWYEEIGASFGGGAAMHGPAVASIAAGRTVGVAPEADLYYIGGAGNSAFSLFLYNHDYAQAIRRILQINKQLPADHKIRVISVSTAWVPGVAGFDAVATAAREAEIQGVLVLTVDTVGTNGLSVIGAGRQPLADPDDFTSYEPGLFWAQRFYGGDQARTYLLVPMDSRTVASPSGQSDYAFYRSGGMSWVPPYLAGVYALATQTDPSLTPDRFWSLARTTSRTIEIDHEGQRYTLSIIDPVALIRALKPR